MLPSVRYIHLYKEWEALVCKKGGSVVKFHLQLHDLMRHKGSGDSEALSKWRRERQLEGVNAPTQASCGQTHLWVCSKPPAPEA